MRLKEIKDKAWSVLNTDNETREKFLTDLYGLGIAKLEQQERSHYDDYALSDDVLMSLEM